MDDSRQDVISKLKFLSRVMKGQKINVKDMTLQDENYITRVSRTVWHIDNRNNTMSFIQNTITSAFNLVNLLLQSESIGDKQICKAIIVDILAAKKGINALKVTYNDDTFFCCGVDTYIQMIDAHVAELRSKHDKVFKGIEEPRSGFPSPDMNGLIPLSSGLAISPVALNRIDPSGTGIED